MKRLWLVLLALLLISILPVQAQSDTEGAIDIFGSAFQAAYVFNQEATGGTLSELLGGLYQLELTGIPAETNIMRVNPPGLVTYMTENLAEDWTNAIENAADGDVTQVMAELDIDGNTIVMALQSASYDAETETMTYIGEIVQYIPYTANQEFNLANATQDNDKVDIPESFDGVILTISASAQFWNSLQNGAEFRLASVRSNENPQCDDARSALDDLNSQLDDALDDDSDADTIENLSQQINYTQNWIDANCN